MGMLMDFYAGPGDELGQAFTEQDFDRLRSLAVSNADFSLHLSPTDLDILSAEAFSLLGKPPRGLLDSLTNTVGGDGEESSADLVDPTWVVTFAWFPESRVGELAERWMAGVAEERNTQPITPTSECLGAIHDLLLLCRTASEKKLDVVYAWSL